MKQLDVDWGLWRSFLAVIDTQSLSGAARYLSMTQPTLGRHIDSLELALGAPLFTRSKAGLRPTNLAMSLLPNARLIENTASALRRQAANTVNQTPSVVRITASQIIGTEFLPEILSEFRTLHPQIQIELKITNTLLNLPQRSADIAIRMARPTQDKLVAKKIRDARLGLYANNDYAQRRGIPKNIDELFQHDLIGYDQNQYMLKGFKLNGRLLDRNDFSIRCDDDVAQLAALRAGLGIGICQAKIAIRDNLVPILPSDISIKLPIWLVMHEDLKTDLNVRAIFDYLAKAI